MMMSEFTERTKFDPTAEEYREIEQEYLGCELDKDEFCRQWVKNYGPQRLTRQRAAKIEELKVELHQRKKEYDKLDAERCSQIKQEQDFKKMLEARLTDEAEQLRKKILAWQRK